MTESVHDYTVRSITGEDVSLGNYAGKALLVVNVASKCGLTPQYEGLEAMYKELGGRGFEVLGFPCNQFGAQEPGTEEEIASFCDTTFGVTFPMFAKIDVNGDDTAPLYAHLRTATKAATDKDDIEWNFTKFLVDGSGAVVKRFDPMTTPEEMSSEVEALLG